MLPKIWATSPDGSIQYASLHKDKVEEALEVLRSSFFKDETVSVAVGLSKDRDAIQELDDLVVTAMKDGISLVAVEKSTGRVVGCAVSKIYSKRSIFENFKCKHEPARYFVEVSAAIDGVLDPFQLLKTDCYVEFMFSATVAEFRGRGINTMQEKLTFEMVRRLMDGENIKTSLDGSRLPLRPVPTGVIEYVTSPGFIAGIKNAGRDTSTKISLQDRMKNSCLPADVVSKLPPITVVTTNFLKL